MVEGKEDQIYGDRRWFDLGQWAHNATYRSCVTELYIWSLCDPINQYYLNKFNKIKEKKRKEKQASTMLTLMRFGADKSRKK